MSLMQRIYQETIVERSRKPRHAGRTDPVTHERDGVNPSCGDELVLTLHVQDDVIVAGATDGHGCAISLASADLMVDAVQGKTLAEAQVVLEGMRAMLRGDESQVDLGELRALEGVRQLHARIKCAWLPWSTLEAILVEERTGP